MIGGTVAWSLWNFFLWPPSTFSYPRMIVPAFPSDSWPGNDQSLGQRLLAVFPKDFFYRPVIVIGNLLFLGS